MFTRSTSMVAALLIVCLNTVLAQSPPPVSFLPAVNYGAGSGPISMAMGDFNGDGKPDLAVTNDGVGSGYCNTQTSTSCLRNVPGFTSAIDGTIKSFTRAHVTADAQYQALQTAGAMRAEGVYVYSMGLGSSPSTTFLQ